MNGKNIVIICSLSIILSLAGYILWSFNNKPESVEVELSTKTITANIKESEKPPETKIKREDLEEALIADLKKKPRREVFKKFELNIKKENHKWIWGNMLAYLTEDVNELPPNVYGFLAKKDIDGNIINFGYMYEEVFEELLTEVDEEIIPEAHKKYLSPNY